MLLETYFAATNSDWYSRFSTPKVVITKFKGFINLLSSFFNQTGFELFFGFSQINSFHIGIITAFSCRPETREMRDDSTMAFKKRASADFYRKGDHNLRNVLHFLNLFGVWIHISNMSDMKNNIKRNFKMSGLELLLISLLFARPFCGTAHPASGVLALLKHREKEYTSFGAFWINFIENCRFS